MKRVLQLLLVLLFAAVSFSASDGHEQPAFYSESVITVPGIAGPCPEQCQISPGVCMPDCP